MFSNMRWLADNYPEVLTEGEIKRDNQRMKDLLYVADKINPLAKTPLLWKILESMLDKHSIMLTKRKPPIERPQDL